MDWLSRLLDMTPVSGHLDIRCHYGAPWRIDFGPSEGEIPYHVVVGGSAVLEAPWGGVRRVTAGDILMLPHGGPYSLHDGSGAPPAPARYRESLNLTISENAGTGERLDMLCGRFALTPTHDRLLRTYVAPILVVSASGRSASTARPGTDLQLAGLVNHRPKRRPDCWRSLAILAWHRHWRPCLTSRTAPGPCQSWRGCATCRGRL